MAAEEYIVLQPYMFRRQKRGPERLEAAPPTQCRSIADGHSRADKIEAGSTLFVGAHLVQMTVDEEAGDYGDPVILRAVGEVPAEAD